MPSHPVRVRPVTEADLPALLTLAEELREQLLPSDGGGRSRSRPSLEERYREAIADPGRHLVLAVEGCDCPDEQVLGMAMFTITTANALLDVAAVHVSHAVVSGHQRKRGAGRALVAAATAFADERGIDQLVVSVHPASREAARFYARLGFAPLAVRRTASVGAVRRRLALLERASEPLARRRPVRAVAVARVRRADVSGS